ncbi:polyprenyl synthetase family protein [Actinoplanes teichomyceticus]|uniref:Geranylgeranyl diphosphate synthase type I n=2 Tax=Actinoplanes teichomyceticus TaxID=1867 RepID=A0A561VSS9_ACTTI|nr:polyprenyl synthetase family protein [Actinoplanes teichomyceticus]TWG14682.1 geranylgeranyl diphosphate synthase type I [Actinoplanes teichomyceticus]
MTSMNEAIATDPLETSRQVARHGVDDVVVRFLEQVHRKCDEEGWQYGLSRVESFLFGSGKRVRPMFCHLGWRSGGGPDAPGIVQVAAALEMFHAFALIHDDVMDNSETRRGQPTLHVSLTRRHEELGWRGQPADFGRSAAILWGDLCLTWADELFHGADLPPERMRRAVELFRQMRSEVLLGQYLDIRGTATAADPAMCYRILLLKSARYTVERPLQIGAALAGADESTLEVLSRYGVALGVAFQLRDDILGAFGDDAETGKSATTDLRDGKSTVLIAMTREAASPAQRKVLDRWYGNPDLDGESVAALRQVIVETGSLRQVEQVIAERTEEAVAALAGGDLPGEARRGLIAMAHLLGSRTS